jgi:hypothetical protein
MSVYQDKTLAGIRCSGVEFLLELAFQDFTGRIFQQLVDHQDFGSGRPITATFSMPGCWYNTFSNSARGRTGPRYEQAI